MRSTVMFVSLILLSCIPLTANAEALDQSSGIVMEVTHDSASEMTTITITAPETDNSSLLDELKSTELVIIRTNQASLEIIEIVATDVKICDLEDLNMECSGNSITLSHYPIPSNYSYYDYWLADQSDFDNEQYTFIATDANILQDTAPAASIENLSAIYSNGLTILTWDYPTGLDMNHSIMIYSHDSPATRENWNEMSKTIVSSSVPAGTTSYQINHSSSSVERDIYYSVTLLYPTSEDTRFLGSNTLTSPVWEDNVAPLFIGELSATFDTASDTTTIDWGAGVDDDDLVINIYRSDKELEMIDSSTFVDSVDASLSSTVLQVPDGEHRQSWYAITLVDSTGNEIMELSEASPVFGPVIESTIDTTIVTNLGVERYGDGTIVVTWDDETENPEAVARVWRSFTGPITSLQDVEELMSVNLSDEQTFHNPLNPQDEAWYAVTIDAAWGSQQEVWHDETLVLGVNSLSMPIRETEEVAEEIEITFTAQVITTSGTRESITDGAMISLGEMDQNDMIVITTSYQVENISCYGIAGDGTSIHAEMDWTLILNANQSGQECGGLIADGDQEISFLLSWSYVETVYQSDISQIPVEGEEESDGNEIGSKDKQPSDVVAITILTILILSLLIYLAVMMKKQDYSEEE